MKRSKPPPSLLEVPREDVATLRCRNGCCQKLSWRDRTVIKGQNGRFYIVGSQVNQMEWALVYDTDWQEALVGKKSA